LTPTAQVAGQTVYSPEDSSTAQELTGNTWSITYGDGSSSSGSVFMDSVSVGGITGRHPWSFSLCIMICKLELCTTNNTNFTTVENQAVEVAEKVSSSFTSRASTDGLLGLAFSDLNTVTPNQQKTFFDNAMSELASPLFTANLKQAEGKIILLIIRTFGIT
jgi:hypothetical protein